MPADDGFDGIAIVQRVENEWPLKRTKWTKFHLEPQEMRLSTRPAASRTSVTYDELRYRLPEEPAAESRSLVATAHEPVAAVR